MSDDLHNPDVPLPFSAVLAALDDQLCKGNQFYVILVSDRWFVFYIGRALIH